MNGEHPAQGPSWLNSGDNRTYHREHRGHREDSEGATPGISSVFSVSSVVKALPRSHFVVATGAPSGPPGSSDALEQVAAGPIIVACAVPKGQRAGMLDMLGREEAQKLQELNAVVEK